MFGNDERSRFNESSIAYVHTLIVSRAHVCHCSILSIRCLLPSFELPARFFATCSGHIVSISHSCCTCTYMTLHHFYCIMDCSPKDLRTFSVEHVVYKFVQVAESQIMPINDGIMCGKGAWRCKGAERCVEEFTPDVIVQFPICAA